MIVLLDTNIILDHLLAREPFAATAKQIWEACAQGRVTAYISPITPVNVFYIARKLQSAEYAHNAVEQMLMLFQVCPLDGEILKAALVLPLKDFEDAVQYACATAVGATMIVTRDPKDYAGVVLAVISPTDLLSKLQQPTG